VDYSTGDEGQISFVPTTAWVAVQLTYTAEIHAIRGNTIGEFRGSPPDVPVFADVNMQELTNGDEDPTYLILPIGKAGAVSANRRLYDDAFVTELERQVTAKRPTGIMGHIKAEDRPTEFPAPDVYWIGVKRIGELLWGKAYVPPGAAKNMVRRLKATGSRIATSIYGTGRETWDPDKKAYAVASDGFDLEQIDLAPPERAGIADLAVVPHLTAEMADGAGQKNDKEHEMDRTQIIREMTAADLALIPQNVKDAILQAAPPAPEAAQVAEIRAALKLGEKDDPLKAIAEMVAAQEEAAKQAVKARISELIGDPEKGIKLESARGIVQRLVEAEAPTSIQEVEEAYRLVVEGEAVKQLLAETVQAQMGPPQGRTLSRTQNGNGLKYVNIPEKEKE
jgi:hypothetical protein